MAKIKARIYVDEVYPVYFLTTEPDKLLIETKINIDETLYQKYVKAKKAWDEVQAELKAIY